MNQVPEWQSEPRKSSQLQIQEDPSSGARPATLQEATIRVTNSLSPSPGLSGSLQAYPPPYRGLSRPLESSPSPQTNKQVKQTNAQSRSADRTNQGERDRRPVGTKLASQQLPRFGSVRIPSSCRRPPTPHEATARSTDWIPLQASPGLKNPPLALRTLPTNRSLNPPLQTTAKEIAPTN